MAQYGIITMDQDREIFSAHKIEGKNMYIINYIHSLLQKVSQGDTIMIRDVEIFGSVQQFYVFVLQLSNGGVALKILDQPYLNFGNGRQWKENTKNFVTSLMNIEKSYFGIIQKDFPFDERVRNLMTYRISRLMLNVLGMTFWKDGIMKKR